MDNLNKSNEETEKYDRLQTEYDRLQTEHEKLKSDNDKLSLEYSENVIIQSMNDMKQRYERMLETTIPKHKYDLLYEKYTKVVKHSSACTVLINHILSLFKQLNRLIYGLDVKPIINKIEVQLITTKDILEESLVI